MPWLPEAALTAIAMIPATLMLQRILGGSHTQWADYWDILPRVVRPDGSVDFRRAFEFQNEHPVFIPGLLVWLNTKLGGSNIVLGTYAVAAAAGTVALLRTTIRRLSWASPASTAVVTIGMSLLYFAPHGVWNYMRAISGTAWLSANLFAVGALLLAGRGRLVMASISGVFASASYGTGLLIWPALVVVLLIQQTSVRRLFHVIVPSGAVLLLYLLRYEPAGYYSAVEWSPFDLLQRMAQTAGAPVLADDLGSVVVGVTVLVLLVAALVAHWQRRTLHDHRELVGVIVYAVGALALMSSARGELQPDLALTSRYNSIAVLLLCGLLVLALGLFGPTHRPLAVAGSALVLVVGLGGLRAIEQLRVSALQQDELATAVVLGVEEGYPHYKPAVTPLLQALGHFPFNEYFGAIDCGYLGDTVGTEDVKLARAAGVRGSLDAVEPGYGPNSQRVSGWVASRDPIQCVLVLDESRTVVGTASYGYDRSDLLTKGLPRFSGYEGVSRRTLRAPTIIVATASGLVELSG